MRSIGDARECQPMETFRCNGVALTLIQFGLVPGTGQFDGMATWDLADSIGGRRWAMRDPFKSFSQETREVASLLLNAASDQLNERLPYPVQCREISIGMFGGMPRAEARFDIVFLPHPDGAPQSMGVGTAGIDVSDDEVQRLVAMLEEGILEDISTLFFVHADEEPPQHPDGIAQSDLR